MDSTAAPEAAPADSGFDETVVEPRIRQIHVTGNASTDSARIVRSFDVPPGSRFSIDAVRRGIHKLMALGLFDDVNVDQRRISSDEMDLVIIVRERPRIATIKFNGNKKRENSDLDKKMFIHAGDVFSWNAVQTQVDSLVQYYKDEGYVRATVEPHADSTTTGQIALRFEIAEGEKVHITAIRFVGVSAFPEQKIRKALKTKKRWWLGGGSIKDETFAEDREKLEAWYHDHGRRDARVVDIATEPGKGPKDLTLVVTVDEGPLYRFGTVAWVGGTVLPMPVMRGFSRTMLGVYDHSQVQKALTAAYSEYAEHGYLYLGIEPVETVRDSQDIVDVTFQITEQRPSNVRYVNIKGNRGTREKVIRREISIHEGDRFRRSALVRTQGDLMRLGFFENVDLDFQPAESTDVDITLKVKEKNVGTASAGAGYAGETGLTGFVEVGHNNVLGNGQSLSLHLERGARRSQYNLSFTEPWFRDTPTLLGVGAYSQNQAYSYYDEKRVGGSVRIGRPLPWPDFSRISVGYRLENVTVNPREGVTTLTPEDSLVLSGIHYGVPQLTSTFELSFSRNSTDNPFYPTRGTRFQFDNQSAGAILGGQIHFHKHRLEQRIYLPSIVRRVTTMMRARVGLVGEYSGYGGTVPPYETFRLGGGMTPDPLRGYDDYMVVPDKYIRRVITFRDTTPNVGLRDSTTYTTVRFPGGRFATTFTLEQQFAIAHPLHGVLFVDAGNVWDKLSEYRPLDLKIGAGVGLRVEVPLLGNIGFDYGYGFNRDDHPRWVGHFLLGQALF